MWNVLEELKIKLITASESIQHQRFIVWARGLDAFIVEDEDVRYTILIAHRIQTGSPQHVKQQALPVPYSRRIFIDRDL